MRRLTILAAVAALAACATTAPEATALFTSGISSDTSSLETVLDIDTTTGFGLVRPRYPYLLRASDYERCIRGYAPRFSAGEWWCVPDELAPALDEGDDADGDGCGPGAGP